MWLPRRNWYPPRVTSSPDQIERQIALIAHTPMYNWHKYWARKTWNVIGEFAKHYCPTWRHSARPVCGVRSHWNQSRQARPSCHPR